MSLQRLRFIALGLALVGSGLGAGTASAVNDFKNVSPTLCRPLGPGTTASELTLNSFGVFNPGATNEMVICEMPADGDSAWSSTAGNSAWLLVYFRAGAVSGKVSCTAYTGSTINLVGSTYAVTSNPLPIAAGARSYYQMLLAESSGLYLAAPPSTLICTLTPKAALGQFVFVETVPTNTP